MTMRVNKKQPNSRMCFVCGTENSFGLNSRFFELENDQIIALFTPAEQHQGYPGRLHGGVAAAILDETIGRAIMIKYSHDIWGVTIDFSMRFKKPVPISEEIKVVARIDKDTKRIFEGSGEILLPDGTPAVIASGKYMKMDISNITDEKFAEESWDILEEDDDPKNIQV